MDEFTLQVVIDSGDPHVLAEWWAETLRWQVEPQDEGFIRQMIEQGHATDADTRRYKGAVVWREAAAIRGGAGQPRMYFQQVPEAKTVKNRIHLDVRVGEADPADIRASLVARGATVLYEGHQGPHTWVTMADPEGNEFCV